jgi:hypothetical protein
LDGIRKAATVLPLVEGEGPRRANRFTQASKVGLSKLRARGAWR